MIPACCPSCGFAGEIEAFLVEPDAKRAIARVAALDPALGRVIAPYLRLFGTGKRGVQLRRAVKLIDELVDLVDAGAVCRDERVGVRRPATPAMWAAGIEQMLAAPPSGPLQNHHYLRAVVYGIADTAEAVAERALEAQRRSGTQRRSGPSGKEDEDIVANAIRYAAHMLGLGGFDQAQHDDYIQRARARADGDPQP